MINKCRECEHLTTGRFITDMKPEIICSKNKHVINIPITETAPDWCPLKEENKMLEKEEINIETCQIWKGHDGIVRQLKYIGEEVIVYTFLNRDHPKKESSCSVEYFNNNYKKELLPCWTPKQEEPKPMVSDVAFYMDKDCNLIIPREMLSKITEAFFNANVERNKRKIEGE